MNRRIIVWFVLAVAILCGLSYASYRSIDSLTKQNAWVEHTYEVLLLLDTAQLHLKDIQTATRGYVITGEERYKESAHDAYALTERSLTDLAELVADNRMQEQYVPDLRKASAAIMDFAQQLIERREQNEKEAVALIRTGLGQQRIDVASAIINTMRTREHELLVERRQKAEEAVLITLVVGTFGLVCCLGILMMVLWMIQRETRRRETVERTLQGTVLRMEQVNEERRMIAQMSDFLQGCRTNQEIYELVWQNMPRMLPGTHGTLAVLSNSRNIMDVVVSWGNENSTLSQFAPEDCWGMRRGKLHTIGTGSSEPDCGHLTARMPEAACMPLVAHGETLGMLYVASTERNVLNESKQQLLRTISEQVSLALANMKLQETLRMQTLRDPLTQLFNRRYMESSLEREILRAQRNNQSLAVIMLDVDHFKRFNDTFGHDAGDMLLKEFAKMLQKNLRGEDIACRFGGEEFILIMPTCPLDIAIKRTEKILSDTRGFDLKHYNQSLGQITVSAGIAVFPTHASSVEELLRNADKALYVSKREGRNRLTVAHDAV